MQSKQVEIEDEVATINELINAINSLTKNDYFKLMLIATYFCKTRILDASTEPEDLLQEAFTRALTGKRKWRKRISLLKFFERIMESISSHDLEKKSKSLMISLSEYKTEIPTSGRPPNANIEISNELEFVFRLFKNDSFALKYLQLKSKDLTPSEIQEKLRINEIQYNTITTRIRRHLTKYLAKGDHYEK